MRAFLTTATALTLLSSLHSLPTIAACPSGGGSSCAFDPFNPYHCGKGSDLSCFYDTICDVEAAGFDIGKDCCQAPQPSMCPMIYDPQECGSKNCPYDNLCLADLSGYSESQCSPASAPTPSPPAECYNDRPRPVRNGERFRFNLNRMEAKCVDDMGRQYQYGELERVADADVCADGCVQGTDRSLLNHLRGFEYNCNSGLCRCLYDAGALADNDRSGGADPFYRTNRNGRADGSISDEIDGGGYACYKLVGARSVLVEGEMQEMMEEGERDSRFVRGLRAIGVV